MSIRGGSIEEKVKKIFEHFDINRDGSLNREEIASLYVATNPGVKFSEEQLDKIFNELMLVLSTKNDCVDGDKGLTYYGLLVVYTNGMGDVDKDLDLCLCGEVSSTNSDISLSHTFPLMSMRGGSIEEKVKRIFEHFDINRDGGLNREEVASLFVATNPGVKFSEEQLDKIFYELMSVLSTTNDCVDGDKGLTSYGLLVVYASGVGDVDKDLDLCFCGEVSSTDSDTSLSHTFPLMSMRGGSIEEKVKRIFEHFDSNRDGGLNREEVASLFVATNPRVKYSEGQLNKIFYELMSFLSTKNDCVDGDKGLTYYGLLLMYTTGMGDVDKDLDLCFCGEVSSTNSDMSMRGGIAEKVKKIFEQFDINRDGVLNREEMTSLIVATNPGVKYSEERLNAVFGEGFDGDKGLTYDGLLLMYNDGASDVDKDFVQLRLQDASLELEKDFDAFRLQDASSSEVEKFLSELGPKPYSYQDLEKLTSNFTQPIGFGGYGEVYKGQFPSGVHIAVKVLANKDVVEEIFMAEVTTMGKAYHRNLVKLYGYCFEQKMKALVYEYMENGSLDKILYENQGGNIEWEKLYGIAIETAKGIDYLHDGWDEQIIHYDIKAGNVLLDQKFSPKITDFGLAKLMKRDVSCVSLTRIRGTAGYNAPETWMPSSQVTYKCDVYSFGMLLFEVLGKRPNGEGENWFPLQVWEKYKNGQLAEMVKECGIAEKDSEKTIILCTVALWCAQYTPELRPSMSDVVLMLQKKIPVGTPPYPFQFRQSLETSVQPSKVEVIPKV